MAREITSKNINGITDLVIVAPIREGFIEAFENVTYETRLRIAAEALHHVRVSAREYEPTVPFSDVTERILTLLDFRVAILDKDLFQIDRESGLAGRRYLVLTATFDGAWEPYMRLIWNPLGDFLDLLFCNCEGYVPAGDNSFADYAAWVRSAQADSAIFYSTTGLTVPDQIYLLDFERKQRSLSPADADLALAQLTMPDPEAAARATLAADPGRATRMALEALNVLYRLADYYPPDRLAPVLPAADVIGPNQVQAEGRYLIRAARSLLQGWSAVPLLAHLDAYERSLAQPGSIPPMSPEDQLAAERLAKQLMPFREQMKWFEDTRYTDSLAHRFPDPELVPSEVQAGILSSPRNPGKRIRRGALLLMSVTDAVAARAFINSLPITYEGEPPPDKDIYHTISFTAHGLTALGLFDRRLEDFPKEFREGMEKRSGLLGDMWENHPRRWTLPERYSVAGDFAATPPPVAMSEVDFVIQLRRATAEDPGGDDEVLLEEIRSIALAASQSGAALAAVEPMATHYDSAGRINGHFNLHDGISQPRPPALHDRNTARDNVSLGEILCGYANDRKDHAPRAEPSDEDLLFNGSFLVVRKIEQYAKQFEDYLEREAKRIADELSDKYQRPVDFSAKHLAGQLLGRNRDGTPLVANGAHGDNDFDYSGDPQGNRCPFASHVRRSNPREKFLYLPAPRIMRRGMSFGAPGEDGKGRHGVVFMSYSASIAEQFELIQRWVNGGNSTGISAAQTDPLVGARPAVGNYFYRFVYEHDLLENGESKRVRDVIRTELPAFTKLHWGLYLFAPSRRALAFLTQTMIGPTLCMSDPKESVGSACLHRLGELPDYTLALELKQLVEDLDVKDPEERSLTPDVWAAIRRFGQGSYRIPIRRGTPAHPGLAPAAAGDPSKGPVVLVASRAHVHEVLSHPEVFSVAQQGARIAGTSGDIYVAMDPDDRYYAESSATNEIMFAQSEVDGFETGYLCARAVLDRIAARSADPDKFKIELRRHFLAPTLAEMCSAWFGLPDRPDWQRMKAGAWSWDPDPGRTPVCPGDFLSPSRHAFFPWPTSHIEDYAKHHGPLLKQAGLDHATWLLGELAAGRLPASGKLAVEMARKINNPHLLGRNIIGMMIGALPPVDGNLRGILYEWLNDKTLWKHQAELWRRTKGGRPLWTTASAALAGPIARAMCKRPAPDLLYRVAKADHVLPGNDGGVQVKKGDFVVVSLVAATQESLQDKRTPDGDASIVFGGMRQSAVQPPNEPDPDPGYDVAARPIYNVHACPAYKMMMGSMTGMLAALLNFGRIEVMPSSLIVEISGWK